MNKLALLFLSLLITGCNGLGSKKVKNIVELSPKLSLESSELMSLSSVEEVFSFNPIMLKNKGYNISKSQVTADPVLVDYYLYTLDNKGNVSAFDTNSNKIIWTYNISCDKRDTYAGGGILYHRKKLYITYGARLLVILDAESGHEQIRKELPDLIKVKPVILNDNIVLVQTVGNQIFALDALSLTPIWQHESIPESLSSSYHVAPIVHNNRVIVSYSSGQVFALSIKNGEPIWMKDFSGEAGEIGLPNFEDLDILCAPIIHASNLYIASGSGKLIKLNVETGNVVWQINASDIQSMSLIGSNLFITNNARQVAAINVASGKVNFLANLDNNQSSIKLKPTIFLPPFVSQDSSNRSLNIISTNGYLYSFGLDMKGYIAPEQIITKIINNIQYYGKIKSNKMFFIVNKKIMY